MTAPVWHPVPRRAPVAARDLPPDGARVIVRDGHLGERIGWWDGSAREWWGNRVDGRPVDWRWSMCVAEEWRYDGQETEDQTGT